MNIRTKGYIIGAIAAATYGTNPIFAIPLYKNGMDTNSVLFFRYLLANELTLVGSYTYTTEMEDCVKILAGGHVSISYIANPVAPLSKGSEVFEKMANKSSEYLKAVFLPGTI